MEGLTDLVRAVLNREALSIIADLLSIAGFILTIAVLLNVKNLKNAYKLRVRGPSLIRDLAKSTSALSSLMNDYREFRPQVAEELGKVSVKLHSMQNKVRGDARRSVKNVLLYIDRCEVNAENEDQVRRTYIEIVKVIEELKDYQKDLDWEL
jgi:Mg2+ and Co2+ transporter CorA